MRLMLIIYINICFYIELCLAIAFGINVSNKAIGASSIIFITYKSSEQKLSWA